MRDLPRQALMLAGMPVHAWRLRSVLDCMQHAKIEKVLQA
jgi:hypothetical protein